MSDTLVGVHNEHSSMRPFLCFSSPHSWKRISNFLLVSVYWCHLAVYIFAINLSQIRVGRTYFNEDLSTTQIHSTGVINHHRSTNIMFAGRKCRSVFWSFSSWYAQWNINERCLYHKNTMWFSIRWMFPYIYIYIYMYPFWTFVWWISPNSIWMWKNLTGRHLFE